MVWPPFSNHPVQNASKNAFPKWLLFCLDVKMEAYTVSVTVDYYACLDQGAFLMDLTIQLRKESIRVSGPRGGNASRCNNHVHLKKEA
jgi:hypothetical protein